MGAAHRAKDKHSSAGFKLFLLLCPSTVLLHTFLAIKYLAYLICQAQLSLVSLAVIFPEVKVTLLQAKTLTFKWMNSPSRT